MSQQINLFNPIFLKQKKYFSATTMAQALGLILLGCLLMVAYADIQLSKRTKEAADTAAQLVRTRDQLITVTTQFTSHTNEQALDDEINNAQLDVKAMQHVFDALHSGEFGDTKGYSGYFRGFSRQIMSGLWLTGVSIVGAGHAINLHGRATSVDLVPAYLERLRREDEMKGKSFSALEIQRPMVDAEGGGDAKAAKMTVPANYIDFELQSSDAPESLAAPGKAK